MAGGETTPEKKKHFLGECTSSKDFLGIFQAVRLVHCRKHLEQSADLIVQFQWLDHPFKGNSAKLLEIASEKSVTPQQLHQ